MTGGQITLFVGLAIVVVVTFVGLAHATSVDALLSSLAIGIALTEWWDAIPLPTGKARQTFVVITASVFAGLTVRVAPLTGRAISAVSAGGRAFDALAAGTHQTWSTICVVVTASETDSVQADLSVGAIIVA